MILQRALRQLRRLGRPVPPRPEASPAPVPTGAEPVSNAPPDTFVLPFEIRPAESPDLPGLAPVFQAAIQRQTGNHYTDAQLRAWASSADDNAAFAEQLGEGITIVAEDHGQAVAFAQLSPADTLAMLYVHPDATGRGIATLLCQYLEDEARIQGSSTLHTRASLSARRYFESIGFLEKDRETVRRADVDIERVVMEKKLK